MSTDEIERKRLVSSCPDLNEYSYTDLTQGYLVSLVDFSIRLRQENDIYTLTIKQGQGIHKTEQTTILTSEQYASIYVMLDKTMSKKRYRIPYQTYTIELDVFGGRHAGLIIAEIEFPSIQEATAFVAPSWFGEDVSHNVQYLNVNLIQQ